MNCAEGMCPARYASMPRSSFRYQRTSVMTTFGSRPCAASQAAVTNGNRGAMSLDEHGALEHGHAALKPQRPRFGGRDVDAHRGIERKVLFELQFRKHDFFRA